MTNKKEFALRTLLPKRHFTPYRAAFRWRRLYAARSVRACGRPRRRPISFPSQTVLFRTRTCFAGAGSAPSDPFGIFIAWGSSEYFPIYETAGNGPLTVSSPGYLKLFYRRLHRHDPKKDRCDHTHNAEAPHPEKTVFYVILDVYIGEAHAE